MVVIPGSNPKVNWSLDKAKSAIVAVFFLEREPNQQCREKMRTSEIQRAVESWFGPIWPSPFSRALKDLRERGEIVTETKGKEKWNSLILPHDRDQLISVQANVDNAIITRSSNIGAFADAIEGWSFYGVPKSLRPRLRARLRGEAREHSDRIDEILDEEFESYVESLVKKARGRLSSKDLKRAEKGLWHLSSVIAVSSVFERASYQGLKLLERIGPEISTIEFKHEKLFPERTDGQITFLSDAFKIPREEVQKTIDEHEKAMKDGRKLFDTLSPSDRKRMAIRLNDLLSARSFIVSVVK